MVSVTDAEKGCVLCLIPVLWLLPARGCVRPELIPQLSRKVGCLSFSLEESQIPGPGGHSVTPALWWLQRKGCLVSRRIAGGQEGQELFLQHQLGLLVVEKAFAGGTPHLCWLVSQLRMSLSPSNTGCVWICPLLPGTSYKH